MEHKLNLELGSLNLPCCAGNAVKGLEATEGYEAFAERSRKRGQKEADTRAGTGDLSAGIGSMSLK